MVIFLKTGLNIFMPSISRLVIHTMLHGSHLCIYFWVWSIPYGLGPDQVPLSSTLGLINQTRSQLGYTALYCSSVLTGAIELSVWNCQPLVQQASVIVLCCLQIFWYTSFPWMAWSSHKHYARMGVKAETEDQCKYEVWTQFVQQTNIGQ